MRPPVPDPTEPFLLCLLCFFLGRRAASSRLILSARLHYTVTDKTITAAASLLRPESDSSSRSLVSTAVARPLASIDNLPRRLIQDGCRRLARKTRLHDAQYTRLCIANGLNSQRRPVLWLPAHLGSWCCCSFNAVVVAAAGSANGLSVFPLPLYLARPDLSPAPRVCFPLHYLEPS